MVISTVFWVFLIPSALRPVLQRHHLEIRRKWLGLPVSNPMADGFLKLGSRHPQSVRQHGGGVGYRPEPQRREGSAQ